MNLVKNQLISKARRASKCLNVNRLCISRILCTTCICDCKHTRTFSNLLVDLYFIFVQIQLRQEDEVP